MQIIIPETREKFKRKRQEFFATGRFDIDSAEEISRLEAADFERENGRPLTLFSRDGVSKYICAGEGSANEVIRKEQPGR